MTQQPAQPKKTVDTPVEEDLFAKSTEEAAKDDKSHGTIPVASLQNYSFTECRALIKTVICAVKTISWGIASSKVNIHKFLWNMYVVCRNEMS